MPNCTYSYKGETFYSKEELADYIGRNEENAHAMYANENLYKGGQIGDTEGGKFFYMRSYNPEDLSSGKKTISIRPEELQTGIYKFGEDFYRVSTRGYHRVSELKERPEVVQSKMVGDNEIKYSHIKDFFDNKVPMHVYDIKKLASKDNAAHAMAADYRGTMAVRRGAPSLVTGKGVFDEYITTLADYITRLEDERKAVRGDRKKVQDYTDRIEQQKTVLEQLQSSQSIRFLVDTGIDQIVMARTHATEDASLLELNESLRLAKAWTNITRIVDITREGKTTEQLSLVEAARNLQNEAHVLYDNIINSLMQRIQAEAIKNDIRLDKVMDKKGNFIIKDIDKFGSYVISGAFSSNEFEQLINAVVDRQEAVMREESYDYLDERDRKMVELLGGRNANTDFIVEQYEVPMFNESTGETVKVKRQGIVTMFAREFYDEMNEMEAKARSSKKWKEYYAFEQKHFDYKLTEEGKQAFEDYMEQTRASFITDTDSEGNYVYNEEAIEEVRKKYDPEVFQDYLDNNKNKKVEPNSGAAWYTKVPKNIKLNPNYVRMTDKQKEFHEWFSQRFISAYENSVFDYRLGQTDIDEKLLSFSSDMATGVSNKLKYMSGQTLQFLKGTVSRVVTTTKSGNTVRVLTGDEHIKAPFKNIVEFIPNNGKTMNPIEGLTKFIEAANAFKRKREVEELLNTVNDFVKISDKLEVNNANQGKQRLSGQPLVTKGKTQVSMRLNATVMAFLTDRFTDQNKIIGEKQPGERGVSFGQIVDSVNALTRVRYMAWAPVSATGNLLMGIMNNITYSASGEYFTEKELLQASTYLKGAPFKFLSSVFKKGGFAVTDEAKLVAELMYRHNMIGDVTEELVYGDSILNKLFALQKGGEFLAQGASTIAQLLHHKVTLTDGTQTNLFKLHKLVNDRVQFDTSKLPEDSPYRDVDYMRKIFDRAKAVNEKIHGDYSHVLLGKQTVAGRAAFLFKTWLPMAFKDRFGGYYEHRLLGPQVGRYRSAWNVIKNIAYDKEEGLRFDAESTLDLVKIAFKVVPGFNKLFGKSAQLSDKVSELDRRNIEMFVREVQMMVALAVGSAMARGMMRSRGDDGDEDDASIGMLKYITNQGERMQSELSMFAVPSSLVQMVQNVIPLVGTLIDAEKVYRAAVVYATDPEKDIYTRGFRKYDSKLKTRIEQFAPLTHSAQALWSSWSQLYSDQPGHK